jgi:hypothetical protein
MADHRIRAVVTQAQNEFISEFIGYNNLEQLGIAAYKGRWNELSDKLKMKEPHSLPNLYASLYRSRMYVNSIREFGLQWIVLRCKFPMILHVISYCREDDVIHKE